MTTVKKAETEMIWAYLLHLSYNLYSDREVPERWPDYQAQPYLRVETDFYNEILQKLVDAGVNMVVLDLGDAVKYESHPEIAVKKAWTVERLKRELEKMRKMGLEPIPKLNFSTAHDLWLGEYSRCVSTKIYYDVCRDLIAEIIDIFNKPRFFHIGMDEEDLPHQKYQSYVVVRQYDLWWHDLYFLIEQVQQGGVRPWMWSDYCWEHPDEFFKKMPKSVLQSNWYYGTEFDIDINYVRGYYMLERHGFDQIPCATNFFNPENFRKTVEYLTPRIHPERLKGFMQSVWLPTLSIHRYKHMQAIETVKDSVGTTL